MGATEQGIDDQRWMVIPRTLIFIFEGDCVLLMKRGLHKRIFPGRYNGIGGHLERDEDPLTGALREIEEETGLRANQLRDVRLRGVNHIDAGQSRGILLFVFSARATTREVVEGAEGTLHWVPLTDLKRLPIVEDLPQVLERVLSAEPFFAHISYDSGDQMILRFADGTP